MKQFLLVTIAILTIPISLHSQNLSAYGVTLGEDKYNVENVLENKGKSIKYDTNKKGNAVLRISYPRIGDAYFDNGTFVFNDDDELCSISFSSVDGGTGNPGMPWEARFQRKAQECKNAFLKMAQNLKLKYGSPDTYSNTSAIWQKGNERISLEYDYQYEYNQFGWIDSHVSVLLKYEQIDLDNADY